jgi:hypothetical protein
MRKIISFFFQAQKKRNMMPEKSALTLKQQNYGKISGFFLYLRTCGDIDERVGYKK